MRLIGDIHGRLSTYKWLIKDVKESIQVGDFGIGFDQFGTHTYINKYLDSFSGNHRFIRGNHDKLEECKLCKNWIPDGHIENDIMFIGGANSIDKNDRIEGVDWWRDEELSYREFDRLIELYEKTKPRIMITHECPNSISKLLKENIFKDHTITRQAFDSMFEIHQPELWVFGHWHLSYNNTVNNTKFICLDVYETMDI